MTTRKARNRLHAGTTGQPVVTLGYLDDGTPGVVVTGAHYNRIRLQSSAQIAEMIEDLQEAWHHVMGRES